MLAVAHARIVLDGGVPPAERSRAVSASKGRPLWAFAALGAVIAAECHTLLILIVGMAPRRTDSGEIRG